MCHSHSRYKIFSVLILLAPIFFVIRNHSDSLVTPIVNVFIFLLIRKDIWFVNVDLLCLTVIFP